MDMTNSKFCHFAFFSAVVFIKSGRHPETVEAGVPVANVMFGRRGPEIRLILESAI